ncbi:hypothetical protein MINS_03290 [Mycolicibacterium insubricum]|uniref:Uncharacterized protein n=1 Tax=Mycolicibacterium insubricum TaxID=444597 RepID=A0A1X0DB06_9MYCO|nr:DUF4062 domain-containing protein [Mycolicibacterium insubricum]MCV7082843.1 DUF4062 domain-containing protein [Mycolicibacterium insubricum]ORA69551.1 hypothetical protein BST26_13250 [Mycolicibacterium insubricum]BBZ64900.1 hypothetical protein MINS_03290 [Mycolicibacterium insubricum]
MRVFISSVRRGLEEERDALPGLITAIGHTPVQFEDFTAQTVPSREACLAGVQSSDAYVLLVGPHYGHVFEDTGQSATHDEWMAATVAGMPRVVYRKADVELDADQTAFVAEIEDYGAGVFRDTFSSTAELQTKVAGKVRELAETSGPLNFTPMTEAPVIQWRNQFALGGHGQQFSPATLEVHVLPSPGAPLSARALALVGDALAGRMRRSGLVDERAGLDTRTAQDAIYLAFGDEPPTGWNSAAEGRTLGLRISSSGQVSAWASLPRDGLGSILDPTQLPLQIASLLRLISHAQAISSAHVAIAVGVAPVSTLSIGKVSDMPRRSAQLLKLSDQPLRVEPDELVTVTALDAGAPEVGGILSRRLIEAFHLHR